MCADFFRILLLVYPFFTSIALSIDKTQCPFDKVSAGELSSTPKNGIAFEPNELFAVNSISALKIPVGSKVTFKSISGNEYEGTFIEADLKTNTIKYIPKAKQSAEISLVALWIDRLAIGRVEPNTVVIPAVAEFPYAKMIRETASYNRNANYKEDADFHIRSKKVEQIFSEWLADSKPKETLGTLLDRMQKVYYDYSRSAEPSFNNRGRSQREYVKERFGVEALPDGVVILPGISTKYSPSFHGEKYFYPDLRGDGWSQYEASLTKSLKDYASRMNELNLLKIQGKTVKNSTDYESKEKEVFDAIVDFGRVAAAFRPYQNGNWGLFGPMIHSMTARLGYDIRNPGFLDIIFQAGKPDSLKTKFAVLVKNGEPFYTSDGWDAVSKIRSKELGDKSTPRGRAQIRQRILGGDPESQRYLPR